MPEKADMGQRRVQPARVDVDAGWVTGEIGAFEDGDVGSLVPPVFAAYARILHPAWGLGEAPVRWETVARWAGRRMHALAEFARVASPTSAAQGAPPYLQRPDDGRLPLEMMTVVCDALGDHTRSPSEPVFGVWEGYPWVAPWRDNVATLSLPGRTHVLFRGPIRAVPDLGWDSPTGRFMWEPPSLIFAADRSWYVASDVDQDSTYVGGTQDLIARLLRDRRIEAWPASPNDPITAGADTINA